MRDDPHRFEVLKRLRSAWMDIECMSEGARAHRQVRQTNVSQTIKTVHTEGQSSIGVES